MLHSIYTAKDWLNAAQNTAKDWLYAAHQGPYA